MRIAGVILAGGLSRRMGGTEKPLASLGGRTLMDHVIGRLAPQVTSLAINCNRSMDRYETFGLPLIKDPIEGFAGPLAGVLAGLQWANSGRAGPSVPATDAIVTAAADTPFLPRDLVERFVETVTRNASDEPTIVLARSGGNRHPTFGLWPVSLEGSLERFLREGDTLKVMAFVQQHNYAFADFDVADGRDPFFNANTLEDLSAAEQILLERTAP